jgi:aminoglycoside 3-N-acetyltransferase
LSSYKFIVPDYRRKDIVEGLRTIGLRAGDVVLTHASVGMLGRPEVGLDQEALAELFLSAFREVLGPCGIWILPAYTYSYTVGEVFDPTTTPPRRMGLLSDALYRRPDAARSLDPIFSVIAFGDNAAELLGSTASDNCFGPESIYARLLEADGAICNVGLGSHSALVHHVEQKLRVPYRFVKRFRGTSIIESRPHETVVAYNVRSLEEPRHVPYFMRLDADARATGRVKTVRVGRGEINLIRARDMQDLIVTGLARDPEYLVLGELAVTEGRG